MMNNYLSLAERTKVLFANSLAFYILYVIFTWKFVPSGGLESVWLFSALALMVLQPHVIRHGLHRLETFSSMPLDQY